METQSQARSLAKILIGVAWLDGQIQPEERLYLAKVLQAHHLDGDVELDSMLDGTMTVTPTDCERWIQAYLGERAIFDDDSLLESISGLIYSDGHVAATEAQLLINIQSEPTRSPPSEKILIPKLRRLYQSWVEKFTR